VSAVVGALVGAQRTAGNKGLTRAARQEGQWRARISPLIAIMTTAQSGESGFSPKPSLELAAVVGALNLGSAYTSATASRRTCRIGCTSPKVSTESDHAHNRYDDEQAAVSFPMMSERDYVTARLARA